MSRSYKGSKGHGYEYWSRRPGSGGAIGKEAKKIIHGIERAQSKQMVKSEEVFSMKVCKWYDESYEYVSDEFKEIVYSESDCYITSLHRNGIAIADMTEGDCYFYTVDELESICRENNLEVVIVS